MTHRPASAHTQRPAAGGRRRPFALAAIAAAILLPASCGQSTARVEVGAPAQTPATSAESGHTDGHTDGNMDGGHGEGGMNGDMDGGHDGGMDGGHTDGPGFTEVPGGILLDQPDHGDHHGQDPCSAPVTPEDYEAADRLIADTVAAMKHFEHVDAAKAAGYVQIAPPFGREGAHWLNPAYMGDGQFVNPNRVESLVYRGDTLEAAMYMMDDADQPGVDVGGCLTPWHLHDNLCIADGFQIVGITSTGDCPTGSTNEPTPRMLHVWLVPHEGGPFAGIFT